MRHRVSDHHHFEESECFHLQRSCPLQSTAGLFLALNMEKTHCTFIVLSTTHHMTEHHIPKDLNPGKSNHVTWWKLYLRTVRYCSAHLCYRPLSEETVTHANTSAVLMDSHVMHNWHISVAAVPAAHGTGQHVYICGNAHKTHTWPTLWPEMSAACAARGAGVGPRVFGHSQLLLTGLYTTSWLFQPRGQPDGSVVISTKCWKGAPNSGTGPKPPKK